MREGGGGNLEVASKQLGGVQKEGRMLRCEICLLEWVLFVLFVHGEGTVLEGGGGGEDGRGRVTVSVRMKRVQCCRGVWEPATKER